MINGLLYQILGYTTYGKIDKKLCIYNKFKISGSTWNKKFESKGGLYFVSDIQDYFEYIM